LDDGLLTDILLKGHPFLRDLNGDYLTTCCKELKVSGFRVQDLATRLFDTRKKTKPSDTTNRSAEGRSFVNHQFGSGFTGLGFNY